jgi:hypothetical protein
MKFVWLFILNINLTAFTGPLFVFATPSELSRTDSRLLTLRCAEGNKPPCLK